MQKAFYDHLGNKLEFHGEYQNCTVWYFKDEKPQKALFTSVDIQHCDYELNALKPIYVGEGYQSHISNFDLWKLMKRAIKELREEMHHA